MANKVCPEPNESCVSVASHVEEHGDWQLVRHPARHEARWYMPCLRLECCRLLLTWAY
jgi:hypothetical protein